MRLINSAFKNLFVLSAACGLLLGEARAATQASAFADSYSPVPGVSMAQSQVVYYRQGNAGQSDTPAFVYIDKEFHTGLLPGGYTVFCLTPGRHGLSAVLDEAPEYGGKRLQPGVRLAAGRTHFIRVDEAGGLEPQLVDRDVAERELASATARRQAHVVSRADAVRSCEYVEKPEVRSYSLSSDVLFGFGKSAYEDIRAEGRAEFNQLERRLSAGSLKVERIAVIGHTDPIGSEAYNDALGLRRAQTVRQMLIDGGMNPERVRAFSEGSRELLSEGCHGSREQVIACHAKDRRVTIEVEASDNT